MNGCQVLLECTRILRLTVTLLQIFLCYSVADPGTIQLFKSGGTLMTALVMMTTLGTMLSFRQWASIFVQVSCRGQVPIETKCR